MFNIQVRRTLTFLELEINFGGGTIASGPLDEKKSVEQAKELISAAEKLLPTGYGEDEHKLSVIREGL